MNIVSPKDRERFYLKLILGKLKGATCVKDLRTYENTIYDIYKVTAIVMGLINHDSQIDKMFEEACQIMLPYQLRKFLALFLLAENIEALAIWEKFKSFFAEDFKTNKENNALHHIYNILKSEDMLCKDYNLPEPDINSFINNNDKDSDNVDNYKILYEMIV